MSRFLERNKKKGLLALLLLFFKRGKGVGAILAMVALLSCVFVAPSGFLVDIPWISAMAERLGLRSMLGGGEMRFSELSEALRAARERGTAGRRGGWFGAGRGGVSGFGKSTVDYVKGGEGMLGEGTYDNVANGSGESVDGVLRPEDANKMNDGVSLSEEEMRNGLLRSAFAGKFADAGGPGGALRRDGVFVDRMGLSNKNSFLPGGTLAGGSGARGGDGADGGLGAGSGEGAYGKGRAVNKASRLTAAAFGGRGRFFRGRSYLTDTNSGNMSKFGTRGTGYSQAYGGGGAAAADPCFAGAPAIGPGRTLANNNNARGSGGAGVPYTNRNSPAWQQEAQGCVLANVAAPPTCQGNCPGEFAAGVSGAVYDGNEIDAGLISAPGQPTPVTPDLGEIDTLIDEAAQLEEDAKKCEEAEATYGPEERRVMGEIQDLSNEANAVCAGGGCKDNASACRRIESQMRQKCNEYNSIAAAKAAACPLQDGYEAMDCSQS